MSTSLGTCTIPAGLLTTGDRIEVQFQYLHTGTATAFTGELRWGATTILSRTSVAGETTLAGRSTFAILGSGQAWNAQSWGNTFTLANGAGSATENSSLSLTIGFRGAMAATTSDVLTLGNFTVIRYPAQTNP